SPCQAHAVYGEAAFLDRRRQMEASQQGEGAWVHGIATELVAGESGAIDHAHAAAGTRKHRRGYRACGSSADYKRIKHGSLVDTTDDKSAVLRAKAEAIAQRSFERRGTAFIRHEVQIARRIRVALVDGRRQKAAPQGENRCNETRGAARALGMADHGFD